MLICIVFMLYILQLTFNRSDGFYKALRKNYMFAPWELAKSLTTDWITSVMSHGWILTGGYSFNIRMVNTFNAIVILNGAVNAPAFYPKGAESIKYGGIGAQIAAETINAIINTGTKFKLTIYCITK